MAITGIHFVYRIALSTVHKITASYVPVGYVNIPVEELADETIRAYNYINDFELMTYAFGQINSKAKRIANTILKQVKASVKSIDKTIDNAEAVEESEEIDYDELVKPRDDYIRSMDLETLISAYQYANGGPDYCAYEYITDNKKN